MTNTILEEAIEALRSQDWRQAERLLEQTGMLSLSEDERVRFLGARASVWRRQGHLNKARGVYLELDGILSADDPRRAEVLEGLAECYLTVGDGNTARQLAAAALELEDIDEMRRMRCQAMHARCLARFQPEQAARLLRGIMLSQLSPGSAHANLRFQYADILLRTSGLKNARDQYRLAFDESRAYDALKTSADVLRREALCRTLSDQQSETTTAAALLDRAEEIYLHIADRSFCFVNTERGELNKRLNVFTEARRNFRRGIWEAGDRHELLRVAHNNLGLADTTRLAGTFDPEPLHRARDLYESMGHDWGIMSCGIILALNELDAGSVESGRKALENLADWAESPGVGVTGREVRYLRQLATEATRRMYVNLTYPD